MSSDLRPDSKLTQDEKEILIMQLLDKIVDHTHKSGLVVRAMGSAAIRRCSLDVADIHRKFRRLSDVDFMTYSKQLSKVEKSLAEIGFTNRIASQRQGQDSGEIFYSTLMAGNRRILFYTSPETKGETLWTDIFADTLDMNHVIDYRGRLELSYPTTPLAELFLQKSQIVRINEKDLKDLCILFLAHDVEGKSPEVIDAQYIANLLSKDWGFYYTVTTNLGKLHSLMDRWLNIFNEDQLKIIRERSTRLLNEVEKKEKSLGWKVRAKVGTSKVWYNQVEEVDRTPDEVMGA